MDAPDWANVPDPEEVPRPRVKVEWRSEDTAHVIVIGLAPPHMRRYLSEVAPKVGELYYTPGGTWYFQRVDRDGSKLPDPAYIPVDPDQEEAFRREEAEIRTTNVGNEAVLSALLAELGGRMKVHRDENRDLAEMGAKIEARKWWPLFWSPDDDV